MIQFFLFIVNQITYQIIIGLPLKLQKMKIK